MRCTQTKGEIEKYTYVEKSLEILLLYVYKISFQYPIRDFILIDLSILVSYIDMSVILNDDYIIHRMIAIMNERNY